MVKNKVEINKLLKKIYQRIVNYSFRCSYNFFKTILPAKNGQVLFLSDSSKELKSNFKFVYNELVQVEQISIVIALSTKATILKYINLGRIVARSRCVVIDDYCGKMYQIKIRGNASFIQLWHAVGAFKLMGTHWEDKRISSQFNNKAHKNYTAVIVGSKNVKEIYAEAFGISNTKVKVLGIPRTDYFFDKAKQSTEAIQKIKDKLSISYEKNVIMYAPTFRGASRGEATNISEFNFKWFEQFEETHILLVRVHPFVTSEINKINNAIIDVSKYEDVNELLLIVDHLITDYSSIFYEYSLLGKPMTFHAPDLSDYISKRGLYVDYYNYVPGRITANDEELINSIISNEVFEDKLTNIVSESYDYLDGKSSERVARYIIEKTIEEF